MAGCAHREAPVTPMATVPSASATEVIELRQRVNDLERQVLALEDRVSQVQAPAGGRVAVSSRHAAKSEPREVARAYHALYERFQQGDCQDTVLDFENFVRRYPTSTLADNAQYWIGECFYRSADYRLAISEFERVLIMKPPGNKIPDAYLRIGMSYAALGQPSQARASYEKLMHDYPESEAAGKARSSLSALPAHGGL